MGNATRNMGCGAEGQPKNTDPRVLRGHQQPGCAARPRQEHFMHTSACEWSRIPLPASQQLCHPQPLHPELLEWCWADPARSRLHLPRHHRSEHRDSQRANTPSTRTGSTWQRATPSQAKTAAPQRLLLGPGASGRAACQHLLQKQQHETQTSRAWQALQPRGAFWGGIP